MPSTPDDYRRLRLAAESARPARSDRDAAGAPAILGRVATEEDDLGAGKFFSLTPLVISGPEIEGGPATLSEPDGAAPVFVLARGQAPPEDGLLVASFVPHRWVWTGVSATTCTWNTVCVHAESTAADVTGAAVQADRIWIDEDDVEHAEPIELPDGAVTDEEGRYCFRVPISLADPTAAPTVDPDGGGTSGAAESAGTYVASYTYLNHFGETKASPASAPYQVGIPDPGSVPLALALSLATPTGTVGSLARGIYFFRHSYANASGETLAGSALRVRVGVADVASGFTLAAYHPSGGSLAAGTYAVKWAATDGTDVTTPVSAGSFTIAAGEVVALTGFLSPPEGADAFRVWLSDDAGTTWYVYLDSVLPVEDPFIDDFAIAFDSALSGPAVTVPAANTFPNLAPTVVFPASMATLRANATEQRLYASHASVGGYHLYASGLAGADHECTEAYPTTGATQPTTNTADRAIARVTFATDPDATKYRVYSKRLDGGCRWYEATASPRDLTGGTAGITCPPVGNQTGQGTVRVTLTPDGYGPGHRDATISGICTTVGLEFPQAVARYGVVKCARPIDGSQSTAAAGAAIEITGPGGLFTFSTTSTGGGFFPVDVPWPGDYDLHAELDPWGEGDDVIAVDPGTFAGINAVALVPGDGLACGCSDEGPVPIDLTGSDRYGSFAMAWDGTGYAGDHVVSESEATDAAHSCLQAGGTVTIHYRLTCSGAYGTESFDLTKTAAICFAPGPGTRRLFTDADHTGSVGATGTYGPSATPYRGPISLSYTFTDAVVAVGGSTVINWDDTVTFSS